MKKFLLLASFALVAFAASCQKPPEKRYPLQAEVISVDVPRGLIIIKHGEIPDLMPAMTMQYAVANPKQIAALQPGDRITAELVVSQNKGHLENIKLISKSQ